MKNTTINQSIPKVIHISEFDQFFKNTLNEIKKYFVTKVTGKPSVLGEESEELFGIDSIDTLDIFKENISNIASYIEEHPQSIQKVFWETSPAQIKFFKICLGKNKEHINELMNNTSENDLSEYQNMLMYSLYFAVMYEDYEAVRLFLNEIPSFTKDTYPDYNNCLTLALAFGRINFIEENNYDAVAKVESIVTFLIEKGANINQKILNFEGVSYSSIFLDMIDSRFHAQDPSKENASEKNEYSRTSPPKLFFSEDFLVSILKHVEDVNIKSYAVFKSYDANSTMISESNEELESFLMKAIETGRMKLVKSLIDRGADVNCSLKNKYYKNSVFKSALKAGPEYLELLFNSGQEIKNIEQEYNNMISMSEGDDFTYSDEYLISLLQRKVIKDINIRIYAEGYYRPFNSAEEISIEEYTILMNAISSKRLNLARELIKNGANVNASVDSYGNPRSVLDCACSAGPEYIDLLFESGQEIEGFDKKYYSMVTDCDWLNYTSHKMYIYSDEYLISLLPRIKDVNSKHYSTYTRILEGGTQEEYKQESASLLMLAINEKRFTLTQALLNHGADVNFVIDYGDSNTNIIDSISNSEDERIKLIFENSPKSNFNDKCFKKIMEQSAWYSKYTTEFLVSLIPYINIDADLDGDNLLLAAIYIKNLKIIDALIEHGVDINKITKMHGAIELASIHAARAGPEYLKAILMSKQEPYLGYDHIDEPNGFVSAYIHTDDTSRKHIKLYSLGNEAVDHNIEDIVTLMREQIAFERKVNPYISLLQKSEFININLLMKQYLESKSLPEKHKIKCIRSYDQEQIPKSIINTFNDFNTKIKSDLWKIIKVNIAQNTLKAFGVCKKGLMYYSTEPGEENDECNIIYIPNEIWAHIGEYALENLKEEIDLVGQSYESIS